MNSPFYLLIWITAVCVAGLIWSLGIKRLFLDIFRERLFELRFRLYSMGMDGELAYNDPAYRTFEMLLCGLVRFAHRITFLTYVVSLRQQRQAMKDKDHVDLNKQIALTVSRLAPGEQKKLNDIAQEARTALVLYMVFTSIPLFTIVMAFVCARRLGLISQGSTKEHFTSPIEQEAYGFESRRHLKLAVA